MTTEGEKETVSLWKRSKTPKDTHRNPQVPVGEEEWRESGNREIRETSDVNSAYGTLKEEDFRHVALFYTSDVSLLRCGVARRESGTKKWFTMIVLQGVGVLNRSFHCHSGSPHCHGALECGKRDLHRYVPVNDFDTEMIHQRLVGRPSAAERVGNGGR